MSQAAPQHIPYGVGCVVEMYVPVRPTASTGTQTVTCYTGSGTAIFTAGAASLESINTTISAAAAGATSVVVASASGIATGKIVRLSGREDALVKSVSSTTVNLRSPLIESHAASATCQSHRVYYTVTAAQAATLFWDGRLEWTIDAAIAASKAIYNQACCCSKYPFSTTMATWADLADEEPQIAAVLDAEVDVSRLLVKAAEDVRKRLDAITQGRAATYVGPVNFTDAVVFAALMRHYRSQRDDVLYERYQATLKEELELLLAGAVYRDANQDGAVDENEQRGLRSVQVIRG